MSSPNAVFTVEQGADWSCQIHWYEGPTFRAPIEEINRGYPTLIRVTGHLLPSISDTPVIISGVQGAEILNNADAGVHEAKRVDDDWFQLPISTRACERVPGTGEMTYHRPTDITDFTGRAQIRLRHWKGDIIKELTTENGGMTLTVEDAGIQLSMTAAETELLTFGKAFCKPEIVSPEGAVYRMANLTLLMDEETTR